MNEIDLLNLSNQCIPPSASPGFIGHAISSSRKLLSKTGLVVLYFKKTIPEANVYRLSSKKPGYYSLDIHKFRKNKWLYHGRDKKKYKKIPTPPKSTRYKIISGVKVWFKQPFSKEDMDKIEKLISVL